MKKPKQVQKPHLFVQTRSPKKKISWFGKILLFILFLCSSINIYSQEKEYFFPGYACIKKEGTNLDHTFSFHDHPVVGRIGDGIYREVFNFDISKIPSNATILSVKMEFIPTKVDSRKKGIEIYYSNIFNLDPEDFSRYCAGDPFATFCGSTIEDYTIVLTCEKLLNKISNSLVNDDGLFSMALKSDLAERDHLDVLNIYPYTKPYLEVNYVIGPTKPQNLKTTNHNPSNNSITLSWEAPETMDAIGYKIFMYDNTGKSTLLSDDVTLLNKTLTNLPNNITRLGVSAYNNDGESIKSWVNWNFTPRPPTNLAAEEISCNNFKLTWDEPENSVVNFYTIYNSNRSIGTSTTNSFNISSPPPEEKYYVLAVNILGGSLPSNTIFIHRNTPTEPKDIATVNTSSGYLTSWKHSGWFHDRYLLNGRIGTYDESVLPKECTQVNLNTLFTLKPNTTYLFTLHAATGKCLTNGIGIYFRTGSTVKNKDISDSKIININESSIEIYPNPTQNSLNFKGISDFNYKIYDLKGACVLEGENCNESIDVRKLSKGIYQIKINKENTIISKKFIKE